MSDRNKAVIEQVNAAFASGDVEAFLTHCADDFIWTMVGEKSLRGKAAVRDWMGSGPSEPPSFSVESMVADGDLVVAHGDMTMNEKGSEVPYSYCDVWRFRGEKLAELKAFVIKTDGATSR